MIAPTLYTTYFKIICWPRWQSNMTRFYTFLLKYIIIRIDSNKTQNRFPDNKKHAHLNVHGKTPVSGGEKARETVGEQDCHIIRGQPATIIPRPARMRETFRGASFPELSSYVLQQWVILHLIKIF